MKKTIYEAPQMEQTTINLEENFLASVEVMAKTSVDGTWDEAD